MRLFSERREYIYLCLALDPLLNRSKKSAKIQLRKSAKLVSSNRLSSSHEADTQSRLEMCGKQIGTSEEEALLIPQVWLWQKAWSTDIAFEIRNSNEKGFFLLGGTSYQTPEAEGTGSEGLAQEDLGKDDLQGQLRVPDIIQVAGGGGGARWDCLRGVILNVWLDQFRIN